MKKLIKIDLKQKIALLACTVLLFLLCKPLIQLMAYENTTHYARDLVTLQGVMEKYFLPNFTSDFLPTMLVSVIIGMVFFNYLFSKKKVDLYHSIPVSRKKLFITNYISGVIIYLVALIFGNIISILVAIPNHYMTATAFKNVLITMGISFVHFLFGYGITIFTVMITGKMTVAVLGTGAISLYFPILLSILYSFRNYFFVTSTTCTSIVKEPVMKYSWLSPVTSFIEYIQRSTNMTYKTARVLSYFGEAESPLRILAPVTVTVLITLAAYVLYEKRPSEAATKAIAFKKAQSIIRIPLVVLGGLIGAWVMTYSFSSFKTGWIWFGLLLGVLLTHCTLEIIFKESFKAFISDRIQLLVCGVASACIVLIFYSDVTGYNKYIPDREKIASAAVYFEGIDNSLSCVTLVEDITQPGCYVSNYEGYMDQAFNGASDSQIFIDKVFALSQVGISVVDDMINERYESSAGDVIYGNDYAEEEKIYIADDESVTGYIEDELGNISKEEAYELASEWMEENGIVEAESDTEERKVTVYTYYILKNGSQVLRYYNIPLSKVRAAMNEVYKTEEFNRTHFDIYSGINADAVYKTEVYDSSENKVCLFTEEDTKKFIDVYMSDLKNITLDTISKLPVGRVNMVFKSSYGYDESFSGYYIYEEFTNTLEYLKNAGCDISTFNNQININDIQSLSAGAYGLYKYEGGDYVYSDEIVYTAEDDADMLKELAPKLQNANYLWSNEMLINSSGTNGVDMCAYYTPGKGIQKMISVRFSDGKVPESMKKDIAIKIWSENRY